MSFIGSGNLSSSTTTFQLTDSTSGSSVTVMGGTIGYITVNQGFQN
jgi:hypothetical protein